MIPAAVTINWATVIPLLVQLLYVVIPFVIAWVGLAVKDFLDAHTTGKTQDVLEKIAATAVQAVEQMYAGQQSSPALQKQKFDTAAALLAKTAAAQVGVTLSDDQVRALIESAVHALNAGAVALVPGAAPLLPADAGVTNNLNLDEFKQGVLDAATNAVPGIVQGTLRSLLGVGAQPSTPPAQSAGQQTIGQVSSQTTPDVVVQPGVSVGLSGQPSAPPPSSPVAQS